MRVSACMGGFYVCGKSSLSVVTNLFPSRPNFKKSIFVKSRNAGICINTYRHAVKPDHKIKVIMQKESNAIFNRSA